MEVSIRQAQPTDLSELSALRLEAIRAYPSAFSRDYESEAAKSTAEWAEWLQQRNNQTDHAVFVAKVDAQLVGMAGIAQQTLPKVRHNAFIWGVFVQPSHQGLGIGRRLMQACLDWACNAEVRIVRLDVNSANQSARRLYESCRFVTCGSVPKALYYEGVYYDETSMICDLSGG